MMAPKREGIDTDDGGLMRPVSASGSMRGKTLPPGGRPKLARAAAALVLVIVVTAAAALAVPRLVDLRYVNIPLFHQYPPAGLEQNALNPSDRADLVPSAEAARVKADLLADGKIEVQAVATGDPSQLANVETGRSLTNLMKLLQQDAAAGIFEKSQSRVSSVAVGYLVDPADSAIRWCVIETGEATIASVRRDTGLVVQTRSHAFVGRFWLAKVGSRYLIADRLVEER